MNFNLKDLTRFFEKYWYEKSGLVAVLIFLCLCVGYILAIAKASSPIVISTLGAVCLLAYFLWRISLRVPKTKKNSLGFVVSILCEDDEESQKIREDFIVPLRQLTKSSKSGRPFQFIEFPRHIAMQIHDEGDAEKLRVKSRAQFMIFGRVRERVLDGKGHHIIELEGAVSHKPIPEHTQKEFAREFSELFPRKVNISKENDLLSFQFTSEWTDLVAKYIIGIATFLSGDLVYAEELYLDAQMRLEGKDENFPIYAKLVERIPIRLSEINETKANHAHLSWCENHNPIFIDEIGKHLEGVLEDRRNEPDILFISAIYAFLKNRDTERALNYLKGMKDAAKGTANSGVVGAWNYNMAFLYCYNGDFVRAIRHYRKAANIAVKPNIIVQVEDFMCWVLSQEPEKYHINYGLGFFNWKTKGDVIQASKDFEAFLNTGSDEEFSKERKLAQQWMQDMPEPSS